MLVTALRPLALVIGLLLAADPASTQTKGPVDLLKLPSAKLEHASDAAATAGSLKALSDGDINAPVVFSTSQGSALTLVIGFSGVVTLEALEISLGTAGPEQAAASVDLLVSQVSPHAGFHSVRADPLKRTPGWQKLTFAPVGAAYVMLKLTGPAGAQRLALAEVKLTGREGPPQSRYKFTESPAKALDVLQSLAGSGSLQLAITPDEASLFADARDGKLDQWSFAEAALLASGVRDPAERKRYSERLAAIEAGARTATAAAQGSFVKGEALLKFMHSSPMSKGYSTTQTNVSTIIDKGTFNCVSSAALYNVIGRKLGLDLRAIEVPDHAFSILYDGTSHADVETTTPQGFNPARNKAAQAEFEKLTGFAYIPDSNRDQRREVGELGLLAIIYYNHGVELTNAKRHQEALLAYFRAMSLDPEFNSAVKNALAVLTNWSIDLTRKGQFEDAVKVADLGLRLAPQDSALVNNQKAVWSIWAEALMKEGKNDEALTVLARADTAVPKGGFARMQAWVYIRQGEELIKANEWRKALAVAGPALERLSPTAREELGHWSASIYSRWVQSHLRKSNFNAALAVISARMAEHPQDKRATENLPYVVQELLKSTAALQGPDAAEKLIPELIRRFATVGEVKEIAASHLQRTVQKHIDEGSFDTAIDTAGRIEALVGGNKRAANLGYIVQEVLKGTAARQGPEAAEKLIPELIRRFAHVGEVKEIAASHLQRSMQKHIDEGRYEAAIAIAGRIDALVGDKKLAALATASAYDRWAMQLAGKKQWEAALDVYERAMPALVDRSNAENNVRFILQEWVKDAAVKGGPAATAEILKRQVARFAQVRNINEIATNHVRRTIQDLARAKRFEAALETLDLLAGLLREPREAGDIAAIAYDGWVAEFKGKGDWQGAVDVYDRSLKKYAKSSRLETNAVATWYQWSRLHMDKKDWRGAIAIYEKALERFPGNSTLQQNLRYCKQELAKSEGQSPIDKK